MKKIAALIVGVLSIVAIAFVVAGSDNQQSAGNQADSQSSSKMATTNLEVNEFDPNSYTDGAVIGETKVATKQKEVSVVIDDFLFSTTYLRVSRGTRVTWTNQGNVRHNVVSNSGSPETGLEGPLLKKGESYSYIFDKSGVYEYFCAPHPLQMRAVVIVE